MSSDLSLFVAQCVTCEVSQCRVGLSKHQAFILNKRRSRFTFNHWGGYCVPGSEYMWIVWDLKDQDIPESIRWN